MSRLPAWHYPDRWALITGASAGIGAVFARRLAERGMNLVLTARRAERLETMAAELVEGFGIQAIALPADLGIPGDAEWLWHAAATDRVIHLLVNNAGFGAQGLFDEVSLARQAEMVHLNCTAPLQLAHHAIRHMREHGIAGGVINVASIAAFQPVPRLATYGASKAFLLSLSEALWAENRDRGIRIHALCPGRTPTEFQQVAGTGSAEGAFGVRSAEVVVDAGLRAFERGQRQSVPGFENRLATWAVRVLPRSAVTRALQRGVRRALTRSPS